MNFLTGNTFGFFTRSSAYAFMVFNLFSAPCFSAISAMNKELGGIKNTFRAVLFQISLAWILATAVYQVGTRIENGIINIANILVLIFLLIIVLGIVLLKTKTKDNKCIRCPYCKSCTKS